MNSHFSQLDRSSASSSTSIKRSYEQFGLDHDNNLNGSTSRTAIDGSNRNKRARSEGRSSVEAESSSSSSSGGSLETALTSLGDEDASMELASNPRPSLSINHPSPPMSTSSGPSIAIAMEISPPVGPLQTEDIEMATWPHSTDEEESFETALDRVNDFEHHISVLRELPPASSPPTSNPPPTLPFISLLDYDIPPSSEVRSQPSYISWSSRLQQDQQQEERSLPNNHHSSDTEDLQALSRDIATLRDSLGRSSPPLSHPSSRRPSSRGLRLPLPRFSSESSPIGGDRWPQDPAESPSLRMFEREHPGMAALNRQNNVEYPVENRRRDNFPVDRGHLPSFSRHLEALRTDAIRRLSDSDDPPNSGWPRDESQLYPPLWPRSRRVDDNPASSEASRSSWFSTRPTPSNSLMSESAEHRRRWLQRQMLNDISANDGEDFISRPSGPRSRTERLVDTDRRPRNILIDDVGMSHSRSPMSYEQRAGEINGRRGDTLHLPRAVEQPTRWSPSQRNVFAPPRQYSAVQDGASPMDAEDLEVLRQRRRDSMATIDAFRGMPHVPPASASTLATRRSPSPITEFHHLFDPTDGMASDGIPPSPPVDATGRSSFLSSSRPAIFRSPSPAPPSTLHHFSPASRFRSSPSNNDNIALPSPPEELPHPSSIYRDMDLNAYQHGPFRASLERFRDIDRMRDSLRSRLNQLDSIVDGELSSRNEREPPRERERDRERLPAAEPLQASLSRRERGREQSGSEYNSYTLPPLDFEASRSGRGRDVGWFDEMTRADRASTPMSIRPRSPAQASRRPTLSEVARQASHLRRRPASLAGSRRPHFENAHFEHPNVLDNLEVEDRDLARDRTEMHDLFTRRSRLEASIIDDDMSSSHPPRPPSVPDGQAQGFNQAMEVLRGDGLSSHRQRQLNDRFHRDRSQESRRPSSLWGEMEQRENDSVQRRMFSFRRAQVRREPPAFNFGSTGTTTSSRGAGPGRMTSGRHRSPSNSPTRGSGESGPNTRNGRGNTARRAGRHRLANDFEGYFRFDHPLVDAPVRRHSWRLRNLGDYVRDEDFDDSFESLMNLTASLGEVKPKHTPEHVLGGLPSGVYRDWATPGCDQRCPICLDDYQPTDQVLKISDCSHWLHKACLEQWLHSANTCPVCRKKVKGKRRKGHNGNNAQDGSSPGPPQPGPSGSRRDDDEDDDQNNGNGIETARNVSGRSANGRGSRLPWFFG